MDFLTQPLLTEDGFINQACMNELEAAIANMPPTYDRLSGDEEWNTKKWTCLKEVTGHFAHWAVRQLKVTPFPPGLEKMVGYLDACLVSKFNGETLGLSEYDMLELSLCDINKALHDILMGDKTFLSWNTKEALGDDWLDLHALLHNVCISIRNERRESAAFNEKFDKDWAERESADDAEE